MFVKAGTDAPKRDKWYWWLMTGDGWTAPETNNGQPYLPNIKTQWVRNLNWWFRNPAGNLVGWVLGLSAHDRWVKGTLQVMATTPADETPPRKGWKWSITYLKEGAFFGFPFVGYYGVCEFYFGWRPYDGALGFKLVNKSRGEN